MSKRTHPFIFMCFICVIFVLFTGGGNKEVQTLRSTSNDGEMKPNFEMAPLVRMDGSFSGNPYAATNGTPISAKEGSDAGPPRPVMFTFYNRIEDEKRSTGMDDESDNMLLETWKEKWTAVGWDARILTLEHSKQHPRYEEYLDRLQDVPMNGKSGKGLNRRYNELCFLRWLAMASAGGGWMSDYDIFPLVSSAQANEANPLDLPENGDFTVYSVVPGSNGAGIPCMMSGRAEEWSRMAFRILENGIGHARDEKHWTDMFALMDLRYSGDVYKWHDDVVDGRLALIGREWQNSDCAIIASNKRAIHFSHDAMENGNTSHMQDVMAGDPSQRAVVVNDWFNRWNEVCKTA